MPSLIRLPLLALAAWSIALLPAPASPDGRAEVRERLRLFGHRNWIVVTDAAYPLQTAPGIETLHVAADTPDVVAGVLAELAGTRHVRPSIFLDAELEHVPEKAAPGIGAYRDALARALAGQTVQRLPHEAIIARLDEAGKTFRVLILKTPLLKPYTSVFIQLECGYWDAAAERDLREAMKAAKPAP